MLRRKLLIILLCQTALMMVLALAALWTLHGMLVRMDDLNNQSRLVVQQTAALNHSVFTIQLQLYALQAQHTHQLDDIILAVEQLRVVAGNLSADSQLLGRDIQPTCQQLDQELNAFASLVATLATWQEPQQAEVQNRALLQHAAQLRQAAQQITEYVYAQLDISHNQLIRAFRWLVIGMAVGFLLLVNASILLLMRSSQLVLRPVEQLVEATRQLAKERFDYRINLSRHDEFDELAAAYNHVAEQLGSHEQKRIEVLGQVGATLNHELNNAASIIELQLSLMRRRTGNPEATGQCLREIHETLGRMSRVVAALKHIRRIVLTDYAEGIKMLDLERSIRDDEPVEQTVSSNAGSRA
ncbi:MAG: HAMP domain-containing protein [Phycisphaeraceae bacterium]|nr:HAMP domain-containing protein [Phycisphaeraceae bacterium]